MEKAIKWDTQALALWTRQYAHGHIISLAGKQTHYAVKGTGRPVILIHGVFFDSLLWQHNMDALAESHCVYAIDLWGFGYSTRDVTASYEPYIEQLAAFMQALGLEKASFVGHSIGGGIAALFSARFPEQVEKLVLVDSAGLANPEPFAARFFKLPWIGEKLMNLPGDQLRLTMLKALFLHRAETLPPAQYRQLTWFHKINGTTAVALAIMRHGFVDTLESTFRQLAKLNLPTMIIWGAQDRAIPLEIGQRMHQLLPGSTLITIEEAGHLPNLEQSAAFDAHLTAFLNA
ncbi:MAG: alpha/beta hydrolase [Thiobacillus sp.]|nr:alpha/beta hydrolase [Thiobacillus sp.]